MALTVPTTGTLLKHMLRDSWEPGAEETYASDALILATDLMSLATGFEEDPGSTRNLRLMTQGICAMAQALMVRRKDADIEYNRFSSERIGSFSYQKMQANAASGAATGVALFDAAVQALGDALMADGESLVTAEAVFSEPYGAEAAAQQSLTDADAYGR